MHAACCIATWLGKLNPWCNAGAAYVEISCYNQKWRQLKPLLKINFRSDRPHLCWEINMVRLLHVRKQHNEEIMHSSILVFVQLMCSSLASVSLIASLCFPPSSPSPHHLDHTRMSLILSLLAPPFAVVPCVLEPLCVWPVLHEFGSTSVLLADVDLCACCVCTLGSIKLIQLDQN